MSETLIIGMLSVAGTLIGSITGILTANKMSIYRIQQLEKKVDKHNNLIERMAVNERDIKSAWRAIDDIKKRSA